MACVIVRFTRREYKPLVASTRLGGRCVLGDSQLNRGTEAADGTIPHGRLGTFAPIGLAFSAVAFKREKHLFS